MFLRVLTVFQAKKTEVFPAENEEANNASALRRPWGDHPLPTGSMGAVEPDVQMPGEVHQPGLRGLLLATETASTKVERSGADLIGTVAVDRTEDVLMLFRYTWSNREVAALR